MGRFHFAGNDAFYRLAFGLDRYEMITDLVLSILKSISQFNIFARSAIQSANASFLTIIELWTQNSLAGNIHDHSEQVSVVLSVTEICTLAYLIGNQNRNSRRRCTHTMRREGWDGGIKK